MATANLTTLNTVNQNSDLWVENEVHRLTARPIRAIAPEKGAFFSDSVVIKRASDQKPLKIKEDYIFTEHYHSLSLFYKKDVAGIIVIINEEVENDLLISYKPVGELYQKRDNLLADFIETKNQDNSYSPWFWRIYDNLPTLLPSDAHLDVGDNVGFEYVAYSLEKLRQAITLSDFDLAGSLVSYIGQYLVDLEKSFEDKSKTEFIPLTKEFIKGFDKVKLGFKHIENQELLSEDEARLVADEEYVFNERDNRYLSLKGLIAFKEEIYNKLLNKKTTGIGSHYGIVALPLITTLTQMTNGSTVLFDGYENFALSQGGVLDKMVYPNTNRPADRWSMTKIINNPRDRGGVLLAMNLNTSETYIGTLVLSSTSTPVITWKKLLTEYDIENVLDKLTEHMGNKNNPHQTKPAHVDLGNLENLPPVTREDITCRIPSRKLMTFDAFLLFQKSFMHCVKTVEDLKDEKCDESDVLRNIKLIFSPCGPCGPCCTPHTPKPIEKIEEQSKTVQDVDPFETLYGWYCQGSTKIGIYADGSGGTYTAEMETNSKDCGVEESTS